MTENKYQDRILETIDQLRKRKARPDLERICHMVERRYGISPAQTQGELERLVDSEIVIKVDYKGSTSYRNAAKWGKKKALSGQVLNSNDVSRTLCEAVRALLPELQQTAVAAAAQGVNIREIEKYIVSHNALSKLTKNKLQVALDREVSVSRIHKLPNGNYVVQQPKPVIKSVETAKPIAPSNPKPVETDALPTPTVPPLQAVKPVPGSARKGRPPNKRKRFKKTHGPDFVENYDSSFEEPEPKCDYCLLTATSNCNGKPEELLVCKDCNAKAHPSCMDYSADLAIRSRMSPWQCMDCKTCYICNDSGEADSMLFCDACDKGYHMSCHSPKVTAKPNGKWVCHPCSGNGSKKGNFNKVLPMEISEAVELNEMEQTKQTIDGAPGLPTPCESPVPDSEQNKKSFSDIFTKKESSVGSKENKDPEVPDASDWSIEDVENYFKLAGFPDQALAFREQEIDGKSLLLMKRSDVLTGLSIKLGPALKIYNHVKRLQTRRLDGHLIY